MGSYGSTSFLLGKKVEGFSPGIEIPLEFSGTGFLLTRLMIWYSLLFGASEKGAFGETSYTFKVVFAKSYKYLLFRTSMNACYFRFGILFVFF